MQLVSISHTRVPICKLWTGRLVCIMFFYRCVLFKCTCAHTWWGDIMHIIYVHAQVSARVRFCGIRNENACTYMCSFCNAGWRHALIKQWAVLYVWVFLVFHEYVLVVVRPFFWIARVQNHLIVFRSWATVFFYYWFCYIQVSGEMNWYIGCTVVVHIF